MEDDNEQLPTASQIEDIQVENGDIKTLVDIDFSEYRRKNDMRTIRKNCTLPSWLCYEAEKAHINFSEVLQQGLKERLGKTEQPIAK